MRIIQNILLALLCLSITMSGCSDGRLKTEPVNGVVTLDGEPLVDALVNFSPKADGAGAPGYARTNEKGEYRLQTTQGHPDAGTLPGEYAVTVAKYKEVPTGRKETNTVTGEVTEEMRAILIFPEMKVYTSASTTPFSVNVVKGKNRFDFELKSK